MQSQTNSSGRGLVLFKVVFFSSSASIFSEYRFRDRSGNSKDYFCTEFIEALRSALGGFQTKQVIKSEISPTIFSMRAPELTGVDWKWIGLNHLGRLTFT